MAKKQKQREVLVLVILDESGSMGPTKDETIKGFNDFLKAQKKDKSPCRMMITKFNTACSVIEWRNGNKTKEKIASLTNVTGLNDRNYTPGGSTALYDAISETVKQADLVKKETERVLCVIVTDGEENSSKETTFDQVKTLIDGRTKDGWTFLYIGQDPERWARMTGTSMGQVINYNAQIGANYANMSYATSALRKSPMMNTVNLMTEANEQREKDEASQTSSKT